MTGHKKDIERIEVHLKQWFFNHVFVKATCIQDYPVLVDEQALITNAVTSRQREFSTGRWLARQGLRQFGLPDTPIGIGRLRNPLWPESVMGAISHDGELCAVVLMKKHMQTAISGLGIDLIDLSKRKGQLEQLTTMFSSGMNELDAVKGLNLPIAPAVLLFSIKESVVKALSVQVDDFIDMRSIQIHAASNLEVTLMGSPVNAEVHAVNTGNYVLTAVKAYS